MPQLDKFTYFTQFFWSCLLLFTFYIPICNDGDGVLGISRILKLRNQLVSHRGNNIRSNDPNSLEDILRKGFSTGVSYMYSSLFEVSQWCNAVDLLGKRRRIPLISCFGEISGSRGMERNIFYLISKSSYSTSSNPGWGITCRNDITLIHVPHGQRSFDGLYDSFFHFWIDETVLDPTCFQRRERPPRTSSHNKKNHRTIPPASILLAPFLTEKNSK